MLARPSVILTALLTLLAVPAIAWAQDATPDAAIEPGFVSLFDGSAESFASWEVAGIDRFVLEDGLIVTGVAGEDLGLLYFAPQTFNDFVLRLQFRITAGDDNSGVFFRFRDPRLPLPEALLSAPGAGETFINQPYYADNAAYAALDNGFEVQIDELADGDPFDPSDDGQDWHRTGAIYDVPIGTQPGQQAYQRGSQLVPGEWYDLEIEVVGDTFTAWIAGQQTTTFTNLNPLRGLAASADPESGYVGVQSHPFSEGHVEYRDIRIMEMN